MAKTWSNNTPPSPFLKVKSWWFSHWSVIFANLYAHFRYYFNAWMTMQQAIITTMIQLNVWRFVQVDIHTRVFLPILQPLDLFKSSASNLLYKYITWFVTVVKMATSDDVTVTIERLKTQLQLVPHPSGFGAYRECFKGDRQVVFVSQTA